MSLQVIFKSVAARLLVVAIVGAAIGLYVIRQFSRPTVRAAAVPTVGYTSVLRESVRDKQGQETAAFIETYAVRSDGSYLFRSAGPIGHQNENTLRIIELASKIHVEVRDLWELKSTRTMLNSPQLRDPNGSCLFPSNKREGFLGEEQLLGNRAAKTSVGNSTSWYALDHSCALLQQVWQWDDGAITEKKLLMLSFGEPEKSLFYVPDSFREVPPSQIANGPNPDTRTCCSGATPTEAEARRQRQDAALIKLDKYYFDHRPILRK